MSQKPEMPDWDDLQEIWQDSPDVDMSAMARHARFVWWRMRVNFVAEVILCLGGMGFMLWDFLEASDLARMAFDLVLVLFCLGGVWAAFYVRRGAWGAPGDTALSIVELQIKRAQSAIKYVHINNLGCVAGLPIFLFAFWIATQKELPDDRMLTMYLAMGAGLAVFILFPILSRPYVKRKRALIEKLTAVADQLKTTDD